jgi:hypothetical protein
MTTLRQTRTAARDVLLFGALWLGALALPATARADVITDVNNDMRIIIENTSPR